MMTMRFEDEMFGPMPLECSEEYRTVVNRGTHSTPFSLIADVPRSKRHCTLK
jgi:hypothetical protein